MNTATSPKDEYTTEADFFTQRVLRHSIGGLPRDGHPLTEVVKAWIIVGGAQRHPSMPPLD